MYYFETYKSMKGDKTMEETIEETIIEEKNFASKHRWYFLAIGLLVIIGLFILTVKNYDGEYSSSLRLTMNNLSICEEKIRNMTSEKQELNVTAYNNGFEQCYTQVSNAITESLRRDGYINISFPNGERAKLAPVK